MAYVDVSPPRPVQVLVDDVWRSGLLRGWRRDGRWRGFVTYSLGVGMNKLDWVDQDRLRTPS